LNGQKQADNDQVLAGIAAQRSQIENSLVMMFNVLAPLFVLICGVWLGLLAWNNVRERRGEIGVLRALGKTSGAIAGLFLLKAVLLGLAGGLLGCGVGYLIARQFAPAGLESVAPWLLATLIGSPVVALLATYAPTLLAVQQDPAVVLRDA
ncbi:MAG: FtsX-like permease family protein, partial [Planctomycetales bacterium]|nr:FtsX-like permease family protein [Planctomycetales bacterium]